MRQIPTFDLYGEHSAFPDILHCETINDRAALHDWRIGVHRHADLHQFFVLTAGEAQMTLDGEDHRLTLPALVSVPRLAAHGFRFAKGTQGHVVTLPVSAFAEIFGAESELAARLSGRGISLADASAQAVVSALAAEHRAAGFARVAMLRALALQLACIAARGIGSADMPVGAYARRMAALDGLVRANLRSRWRVADYARAMGMTPTHLGRVTRAEAGLSASAYIERYLFQEARRLLAYTRAGVGEIGLTLGFDDPAYFSRAFRRHCGVPPNVYRESVDGTSRRAEGCDGEPKGRSKMDHANHVRLNDAELTEARLLDATVYGADDEKVGTVSHMHGSGSGAEVIVDVGGFLGIGAKPVAVPVSQLDFMYDESGKVHAVTSWTKDDLKLLPSHHH